MIIAPTGAGKSLIIADVASKIKDSIIVLQPNKELLEQNYSKYLSYGNKASVFSASLGKKELGHVTFATIGSIKAVAEEIKSRGVGLVIIDECHFQSKRGSEVAKFLRKIQARKVIGLTATPLELRTYHGESSLAMINRSKKNIFQEIIHVTQVPEIAPKFWAKLNYELRRVDQSSLKLNTTGADFTDSSIKAFYDHNNLKHKVLKEVKVQKFEGRKSIIIFVSSIEEAEDLSKIIPNSTVVHSKLSKLKRDAAIQGFRSGEIEVIVNVNILSIGFDHPKLDCIITTRPTNSFVVYYQTLGRGVRQHETKEDCKVIDYSGNVERFGRLEKIEFLKGLGSNEWGLFIEGKRLTSHKVSFKEEHNTKPAETEVIWFGKHSGKHIKDIPTGYLKWIITGMTSQTQKVEDFKTLVQKELDKRGAKLYYQNQRLPLDAISPQNDGVKIFPPNKKPIVVQKDDLVWKFGG